VAVLINKIDELTEDDHYHINKGDGCFYFLEYPSGKKDEYYGNKNYSYIHNFKKSVDRKGKPEWKYKGEAIDETIDLFDQYFKRRSNISMFTLVPIPPSKIKSNRLYDDRMSQVLRGLALRNEKADFRELILTKDNMSPSHEANFRPTIQEIKDNYKVDDNLIKGCRKNIILFDDVLTSGAHFCAARAILKEKIEGCNVKGIFIARRVLPNPAYEYDEKTELPF